jgi:hypothetical protein
MAIFKDLTGKKFGRLMVIKLYNKKQMYKNGKKCGFEYYYLCRCDCGNEKVVRSYALTENMTKSCGCLHKEIVRTKTREKNIKHGMSKSDLYKKWSGMKSRCYNKKENNYHIYGQRGIKICAEWVNSFESFYKWAIENGYKKELSIDRINVNGNYEPSNCRWVTWQQQQNNKRTNHFLEYNGQKHTIAEWSKITGIKRQTIWARINNSKWTVEEALTKEVL